MADEKPKGESPLVGEPGAVAPHGEHPEQPKPADQPKLVAVRFNGQEYQLPEEAARAWQERETTLSRQGQELGEYRTKWKQIESQVQPPPREPDINTLWFENPAEAYKKIKQEVKQEVTQDYQRDQALKTFWDGFYRKNDDLREDDFIVEAVMQRNFNEIADLPTSKAQERLGELTRQELIRLTRKVKVTEPDHPRSRAGLSEPATGERPPRPTRNEDDDGPKSIGEVIKARAAARSQPRVASRG